ncbi:cobalamin biosynthetic protein [Actibacterium atlanticum]|uniref:threonine-phosphate decarboxylase n=1 Tax=Actibacterium atlanticum TaxID=1461693 RepID=A0A058ZKF9_9RHOB|nr:threonine-phosphate decarboxylase CobD [Actibacterium atlanticum]KCV81266.1 cobalamin biosynthetic protein [Actibacterium atlanticum]
MRDHGGNLDGAMARFGGDPSDWIDLSTGINRVPYPMPDIPPARWQNLPTKAEIAALCDAAARAYRTQAPILPLAGAQGAIQLIPQLRIPGEARVLAPTYNEHAASLRAGGWTVQDVPTLKDLHGADLAVVVNPNNPDGQTFSAAQLKALRDKVGLLVVDESFADPRPDLSVASIAADKPGLLVLRSFGKFYGLAGLRLGFVLGHGDDIAKLAEAAGPWPISGAAIEIGLKALADTQWAAQTTARLRSEVPRIDVIAAGAGWDSAGGGELFRLYATPNAEAAQDRLAKSHIWSRIFPWSPSLIRLGLPGTPAEWARLKDALD